MRIQINTSIYLEQETIKAIVELRFNPEGVAHLALGSKGLSILVCRVCTTQETERVHEQEQALSATEKTHLLDDLLCLPKGTTRAPADNFWELKMNIATFMSLVWVLFGSQCDYYKSLRQIFKTLELKEVYALKASFTAENCRRITWVILANGRAFFDDVKTKIDFTGPDMTFPQLYLIDILNNIRYAVQVKRASFLDEWRCRKYAKDNKNHARTPGGQGVQERASEQSLPPGGSYGGSAGGPSRPIPYGQGVFGGAGPGDTHYGGHAYMEPFPKGGGGGQRDWKSGWHDVRNH